MNEGDSGNVQRSCLPCKISGSATFFLIAAYFHFCCKHVKPVYYIGIPSMVYLSSARALDLPPFNN